MPRYSRRFRRYRRRSAKWAANLQEINTTTIQAPAQQQFFTSFVLAFNPTQLNTSVSQVFTVKNLEVNFYIDCATDAPNLEDITAYIMFVPQGMPIGLSYNLEHPEYIMAYKYLGSPSHDSSINGGNNGQNYQPTRVKTRLSRKLQSGDNVILFVKGSNLGTADKAFDVHGLVRWWTKAN